MTTQAYYPGDGVWGLVSSRRACSECGAEEAESYFTGEVEPLTVSPQASFMGAIWVTKKPGGVSFLRMTKLLFPTREAALAAYEELPDDER